MTDYAASSYSAPVSIESLNRAAEMAGHSTACPYSSSADFLAPDYARWRTRRLIAFVPLLLAFAVLSLLLLRSK